MKTSANSGALTSCACCFRNCLGLLETLDILETLDALDYLDILDAPNLSFVISIFIAFFSTNLLNLINVPDVMMADANSYMKIVGCFIFADAIIMIFSQIFNIFSKQA